MTNTGPRQTLPIYPRLDLRAAPIDSEALRWRRWRLYREKPKTSSTKNPLFLSLSLCINSRRLCFKSSWSAQDLFWRKSQCPFDPSSEPLAQLSLLALNLAEGQRPKPQRQPKKVTQKKKNGKNRVYWGLCIGSRGLCFTGWLRVRVTLKRSFFSAAKARHPLFSHPFAPDLSPVFSCLPFSSSSRTIWSPG